MCMPTENSQVAIGMVLHHLDQSIAYSAAGEMGKKLVIRDLPFEPARLFEGWHMRQQEHIRKTRDGGKQMNLEIARRFIAESAQSFRFSQNLTACSI